MKNYTIVILAFIGITACSPNNGKRNTISLNGTWQIAEGKKDVIPSKFDRTIAVPGLITSAKPAFVNPAPPLPDRSVINTNLELFYHQQDSLREAYWYRRTFNIKETIPSITLLKVGKAMFGAKVYLNGSYIGEHLPCFTPGYFDLKKFIRSGENELVISVGSCRNSLPQDMPDGFDYEKERYISGIFDNVDLILSGAPFIRNVQVAPDIVGKTARIQVTVMNPDITASSKITVVIREAGSGTIAGDYTRENVTAEANIPKTIEITVPIRNCRFWSPEDPFLYNLEVSTPGDNFKTRFGMRELRFDPVSHLPVLNGKNYFMRGSNISIYRFFEDSLCGNLPWNYDWVRKMHRKFITDMNWNSLRYCIGFPPEEWYNIADEEGILIQDEFPIWYGDTTWNRWTKHLNSSKLATEFKEWMQERWNHPSVVIWDATNETRLSKPSIDSAIANVRKLDLSGRAWDNSYSTVRADNDIFESHPYHFSDANFKMRDLAKASIIPEGNAQKNSGNHPVIINEYGWLWLNRDGSPTTLTKHLYENLLGKEATADQRRETAAHLIAAETEFWRCHRKAAGVLYFTALGYDRANGQTSDNWLDLVNLVWDPQFLKQVGNSFTPVGLMVDFWQDTLTGPTLGNIPVITINDLGKDWTGNIRIRLLKDDGVVQEKTETLSIPAYGQGKSSYSFDNELKPGNYTIEAALIGTPYGTITSTRHLVR
ncbi:MAG: hypothetical protein NTV01_03655 [Bacteroidia bacterium]|nr:hypothetical protein [Bacteroidia bacterium]